MNVVGINTATNRLFTSRSIIDNTGKEIAESDIRKDAQNSSVEIEIQDLDDEQMLELMSQ